MKGKSVIINDKLIYIVYEMKIFCIKIMYLKYVIYENKIDYILDI